MADTGCTCPPFIDGGVIRRKSCPHHAAATPLPTPEVASRNPEADEVACAWSDYRSDYGASGTQQHKAFLAGWKAAREGDQSGALR